MGILYNRLLTFLNDNSPDSLWYHIAYVLLQHVESLATLNINEIAQLCSVSKSSISKFVRSLGYQDYADFRYAAQFELDQYRPQHTFVHNVLGYLDSHSPAEYVQALTADLEATVQMLDMAVVDRLAGDLHRYSQVAAFGLMFSETAAIDLQFKLARTGKFIQTMMEDSKQLQYMRDAGEDTLVIVFTDQGGFLNNYEMIDPVTGQSVFDHTRAKLVMITSNEKALRDRRLAYVLRYARTSELHTHRVVYPFLTDLLAYRYHCLYAK